MSLRTKATAGLLALGTLMTGILPAIARPATVTTTSNLRTDASLRAPVEQILPPSSNIEVLNIRVGNDGNYWYYVQPKVKGILSGWIRSDLVSFNPSNKRYATLAGSRGSKINVRAAATLNSKAIHYGLVGDLVTVEDSYKAPGQFRWYRVRFPSNASGWVRGDLLSIWQQGCIITCPEH
ncbi:SH3 domain-containing protein [Calothrix sp. PCC 6303]|uniref:SH3 domain-containing protein n=1 Tax=Calothrix sp. PCC 6303 TaxID=1170562 RepID=UPI0002A044FC|nr:SH3 domain-containing protein [Calothrix sp. PCC 6303]AFZ04161.1 SH3 type 3 domain protein [Calothrix sp. PCC 6303]